VCEPNKRQIAVNLLVDIKLVLYVKVPVCLGNAPMDVRMCECTRVHDNCRVNVYKIN